MTWIKRNKKAHGQSSKGTLRLNVEIEIPTELILAQNRPVWAGRDYRLSQSILSEITDATRQEMVRRLQDDMRRPFSMTEPLFDIHVPQQPKQEEVPDRRGNLQVILMKDIEQPMIASSAEARRSNRG